MAGITNSRGSLCWRASSESRKAPNFWLEDPRVCKEKEKAPGTNLGYSMVVLPKERPNVPLPAKKNLQPDTALQILEPTEPTDYWGRRKITQVISWVKTMKIDSHIWDVRGGQKAREGSAGPQGKCKKA